MSRNDTSHPPPRKRWGQNFLHDRGALDRIVAALGPAEGDRVIEIGPGRGALTRTLIDRGFELEAWEIDPMLVEYLEKEFHDEGLHVKKGDALEIDLPEETFRAVGNLPYNVANPIIRRLVRSGRCSRAVFMVQREVADRYTAEPGDTDWGYLGASTRLFATTRRLFTLGPGAFTPRPKVESAVVLFEPMQKEWSVGVGELDQLLSAAFRQRRKTMLNNLKGYGGMARDEIAAALERAEIPERARAEELSLEDFEAIAEELQQLD